MSNERQSDTDVFKLWDSFLTDLSPLFKSDKITLQRELFSPVDTAIYGDEIPVTSIHSDKQALNEKTGQPLKKDKFGNYSNYAGQPEPRKSLASMFNDLGSNKLEVCEICGSKLKYSWLGICQACKADESPGSMLHDSIFGEGSIYHDSD
jgi:hypothetical protein